MYFTGNYLQLYLQFHMNDSASKKEQTSRNEYETSFISFLTTLAIFYDFICLHWASVVKTRNYSAKSVSIPNTINTLVKSTVHQTISLIDFRILANSSPIKRKTEHSECRAFADFWRTFRMFCFSFLQIVFIPFPSVRWGRNNERAFCYRRRQHKKQIGILHTR